jgi:hypothetical protein
MAFLYRTGFTCSQTLSAIRLEKGSWPFSTEQASPVRPHPTSPIMEGEEELTKCAK